MSTLLPLVLPREPYINGDDLALDIQKDLQHLINNNDEPTTDECYEKLKLVSLEPIDPLFLAAFNIFGKFLHKHG